MTTSRRATALVLCASLAMPATAAAVTVDLGPATGPSGSVTQTALPTGVAQIEVARPNPADPFTDLFAISGEFGSSRTTVKGMVAANNTPGFTQTLSLAGAPRDIAVEDVNGDGYQDILAATAADVSFMRGFASTTYGAATGFSSTTSDVALGLMNADLLPDLVTARPSGFSVFGNTGNAATPFVGPSTTATVSPGRDIAVGDFDADGDRDVALSTEDGRVTVWAGTGSLTFTEQSSRALPGLTSGLAVGDVTGDARPEVVAAVADSHAVFVSGLTGSPAELTPWTRIDLPGPPQDLALADLDGDGRREIVTAQTSQDAVAVIQPGEAPVLFPAGTGPASVAVGDMTGDGRPDVVAAPADPAAWLVLANRGLPRALVAPSAIDAGAQALQTIGAPRTVTVTAQDAARLRVGAATIAGPGRLDHLVTDDCAGAVLEPGQSCTIAARFAPSAAGARDATLSIPTSAGAQVVSLTGQGTAGGGAPVPAAASKASLSCKVVKVKGRARRGIDCRATLTGVTGARRLSARLRRGKTTLASATAAPGGTLKLRPRKVIAKGRVSVALTVTTGGASVTATRTLTVR